MAIIGKIRAASGLMVIVIGVAMVAFIMGDLFSNRGQTNPSEQEVGSVFDEPISLMEFDARVSSDENFIRNSQPNAQDFQVRQQIWNQLVREKIFKAETEAAGITFTKSEFDDLRWGKNLLPELRNDPSIIDSITGQPDRNTLRNFFLRTEQNDPLLYQYQKRQIRNGRMQTKYNELVKSSLFVNSMEAQHDLNAKNTKADLRFIARPFTALADSLIEFNESDLEAWYSKNKNKEEYEQVASRSFEYVVFDVQATEGDIETIQNDLIDIKENFERTVADVDSLFASDMSSAQRYVLLPYQEGSLDNETDELIMNADTGDVIGPYKEGNSYKLAKIKSLEMVPEVRYQQIQISPSSGGTLETSKERADSILKVIKRKRNFAEMVTEFSDDLASKNNEGIIEWIDESRIGDKKLATDLFEEAGKNELRVVQGDRAIYIYRKLEVREREQRNIVVIDRTIRPLEGTYKAMYKVANKFSSNNSTAESLRAAAQEEGLVLEEVKDMPLGQRYVRDLREPTALIRWVNKAEPGQVSEPFRTGERFVVAVLSSVKEKGAPTLDNVRDIAETEVIKEKKAEQMLAEMKGIDDIDELATAIGETVRTASTFTITNNALPGGFQEPELIGLAFALQPGETTVPLKGENGVYVIKMESITEAPEISDVSAEQRSMLQSREVAAANAVYRALERNADVQDERAALGY